MFVCLSVCLSKSQVHIFLNFITRAGGGGGGGGGGVVVKHRKNDGIWGRILVLVFFLPW